MNRSGRNTCTPCMADNLDLTLTSDLDSTSCTTLTHDLTPKSLNLISDTDLVSGTTLKCDAISSCDKMTLTSDHTWTSEETSTLSLKSAETGTGAGRGNVTSLLGEEKEVGKLDKLSGIRLRSHRFEVIREEDEEEEAEEEACRGLEPVSDSVPVHLCGRGAEGLFVVVMAGELTMSTIEVSQKSQTIFQQRRFWHEGKSCVVTTFLHETSKSYLAVQPHTNHLTLFPTEHGTVCPVVSLHGSSPSSDLQDDPQPQQACLFVVLENGHACLQPFGCETKSVAFEEDGRLQVVQGRRWVFNIMPARKAFHVLGHLNCHKLLKKFVYVIVACRI